MKMKDLIRMRGSRKDRRLVVAHELSHLALGHLHSAKSKANKEKEADTLAAGLGHERNGK